MTTETEHPMPGYTPVLVSDLRDWASIGYVDFKKIAPKLYRSSHWCAMCPKQDERPMYGDERSHCEPCSADQAYEQSTGKKLDVLSGAVWIPTKTAVLLRMNCAQPAPSHETE